MKIRTKIFIFSLLASLSMAVSFSVLARMIIHSVIFQKIEESVRLELIGLIEETRPYFSANNEQNFLETFQEIMARDQLFYVAAINPLGRVIAHTNVGEKGKVYPGFDVTTENKKVPVFEKNISQKQATMLGRMAVWSTPPSKSEEFFFSLEGKGNKPVLLGHIQLAKDINGPLEMVSKISQRVFIFVGIFSMLTFGVLLVILGRILKPIPLLVEATEKICSGSFGDSIPIDTHDELAALANSFNRMSRSLSETTVSKNLLSLIIDNLLDIVIVTTPDYKIELCNHMACFLLGYSDTDLIGKPVSLLFEENSAVFSQSHEENLNKFGLIMNIEESVMTKNGKKIPSQVAIVRLDDPLKINQGTIFIVRDMREINRLNSQIIQVEKLAALGELGAGFAHEFNTPLTVILGYLEIIKRRVDKDNPIQNFLTTAIEETNHCADLIKEFLFYAQPNEKDFSLRFQKVDVKQTINTALRLVGHEINVNNIRVDLDFQFPCPCVQGDPIQVLQLFMNIINNAIQALDNGGQISISAKKLFNQDMQEPRLEFRVMDTGIGISRENIKRVFDPFFTTKRPGKGAGLGLSIVMRIITNHKGKIRIESEPNRGTAIIGELLIWDETMRRTA